MAGSSQDLHERREDLSPATIDRHRATVSLLEELEAVDWYDQRAEAAGDAELKEILLHNRDEEMEHAAMVLEWLRRRNPVVDENHNPTFDLNRGPVSSVKCLAAHEFQRLAPLHILERLGKDTEAFDHTSV